MDEATRVFFRKQHEEPENQACIDCGSANPQWASVSHGCYISLESSGVHRSLGVHISFVRSTTMDSWKPLHLKLMELGGNRRLGAHFRQHDVPDDMPIVQKYNTRAAEWYRRNLRALAEGNEPPPPLPEGTGHLPLADAPPCAQPSFAKAAAHGGMMSAGGAFASDARHYGRGGYHDANSGAGSAALDRPVDSVPRKRMDGFGSDGPARSHGLAGSTGSQDEFLAGFLGPEVGSKVSTGVWSAVGFVGTLANKAKTVAEAKVVQAQTEGWLDTTLDTARQGVVTAVETTTWAAQKSAEATSSTYVYLNDGGTKDVLDKTTEALGTTAKKSITLVGDSVDWISQQVVGSGSEQGLQNMSSGKMQGFGSDCPPLSPSSDDGAPATDSTASPSMANQLAQPRFSPSHVSYHCAPGAAAPLRKPSPVASPPIAEVVSAELAHEPAAARKAAAAAAMWNDDDWGDWK